MATDENEIRTLKYSMQDPVKSPAKVVSESAVVRRPVKSKPLAVARKPGDAYAQALRWSLLATAGVSAGIVAIAYYTGVSAFEVALVAGALGAFFSCLLRLSYAVETPQAAGAVPVSVADRAIYAVVPPLIGAIAAAFCYIVFAAGFVEGGAFFPRFGCVTVAGCSSFGDFVDNYGPLDAVHYARLCVWAFAAGFAERLVPDRLRSMAARLASA